MKTPRARATHFIIGVLIAYVMQVHATGEGSWPVCFAAVASVYTVLGIVLLLLLWLWECVRIAIPSLPKIRITIGPLLRFSWVWPNRRR